MVGEAETQLCHQPHHQLSNPQWGGNSPLTAALWGAEGLGPTPGTPTFMSCSLCFRFSQFRFESCTTVFHSHHRWQDSGQATPKYDTLAYWRFRVERIWEITDAERFSDPPRQVTRFSSEKCPPYSWGKGVPLPSKTEGPPKAITMNRPHCLPHSLHLACTLSQPITCSHNSSSKLTQKQA